MLVVAGDWYIARWGVKRKGGRGAGQGAGSYGQKEGREEDRWGWR